MAAQANNLELLKLDSYEWRLIESLVKVLEKYYTVTVIMSGSRYPTLSKSYWCSKILLKFLKTQDSTESSFDQIRPLQNSNNRAPPETFPLIIILDPYFNKNGTDEAEAESGKVRLPTSPTPPPSISSKHWRSYLLSLFSLFLS